MSITQDQYIYDYDMVVLGGGAFGSTLASVLGDNQKKVKLWVRSKEQADEINQHHTNSRYLGDAKLSQNIEATNDLSSAVQCSRMIMMAIPTQKFREVARKVGETFQGDQMLVHVAKGLELKTFKRVTEIIHEETCARKIGVLSGPNLAKEMILGQPTGSLISSKFDEVSNTMQDLYRGSLLRLYSGQDVIGTEISGAFKNIVAFMVGIAHGKGYKDNTKSLLITRGLQEMIKFGVASGADFKTFGGLAGVGDLMATCFSPFSRNRQVGERVGQGEDWHDIVKTFGQVVEGITTTKAVHEKAVKIGLSLPIVSSLYALLYEGAPLDELETMLMNLPVGEEVSKMALS